MNQILCEVHSEADDLGTRTAVIQLLGGLAQIPSTSNSRNIYSRRNKKTGKQTPFISISKDAKARIELLSWHYRNAAKPQIAFNDEQVFCRILHANKKGRWDSHNVPKALCDWLENMRIVNNDSQIEAWPSKKKDYPIHFATELDTTTIFLIRYDLVSALLEEVSKEIEQIALGQKVLYGKGYAKDDRSGKLF